ncbi:MAG: glycosyltransferase family 2 protein [Chloroflexi bacterium]|nr:glycosyltransferase family 2 protein [Chloroflexota bacterium]
MRDAAGFRGRCRVLRLTHCAARLTAVSLFIFTLRRWLLLLAALRPKPDRFPQTCQVFRILLLVPFYNEENNLPGLLSHLDRVAYPAEYLTIVLVDDGSTDGASLAARRWVAQRPSRHLLTLPRNVGKAAALNAALSRFPQGDLIAVYDADERPSPDTLRQLAACFVDERVGAVNGRRAISNPLDSPMATYAAFENLVHEQITMRGKDRLRLAPALLGSNCVYRRAALKDAGGFRPGALLEDTEITLKLAQAGWETRYVSAAVSHHAVPHTIAGYWRQRLRWSCGFQDAARLHAADILRDGRLSLPLRLELTLFSFGYLDRLFLLTGLALCCVLHIAANRNGLSFRGIEESFAYAGKRFLTLSLTASLLTPLFQVIVALRLVRAPLALWRRVILLPFFLGLDILITLVSFWQKRLFER